jgi:hypothetical protein
VDLGVILPDRDARMAGIARAHEKGSNMLVRPRTALAMRKVEGSAAPRESPAPVGLSAFLGEFVCANAASGYHQHAPTGGQ